MNIWIIDHYSVPIKYYPLARQTIFAQKLIEMGHSIKIFAASTVHNSRVNLIEDDCEYKEVTEDGVDYILIKCRQYVGNGIKRVNNMLEFARKLPRVCKKYEQPDVIISTSMTPFACAVGLYLGKKFGCKKIAQITDLWPETLVAYKIAGRWNPFVIFLRRLEKWIYCNADRIIFSMEGAYDYIIEQKWDKKIPRSKVVTINNGVDLKQFDRNKELYVIDDSDLNSNKFKVVYTGSVRKVNNLGILLDVAKFLSTDICILIWGEGDELELLKERVVVESINNVIFKGRVEKKYIPYITSMADLNIAHNTPTSLFRFGISFNKMFDYLAAGKPVLSDFPCPYNPAIMYEAGIEVEEPVPEKIAEKIVYISELDKVKYDIYCQNARKAAMKYDFNYLTKVLLETINMC